MQLMAMQNLFVVQVLPQKHTQVMELRTVNQTDGLWTCMRTFLECKTSTYLIISHYKVNEVIEECFWRKGRKHWLSICPNNSRHHLGLIIPFIFFTHPLVEVGVMLLVHCPRVGPWPSGPGADPGPALKGQGKGQQISLGSALGQPWPY